MAEQMMLGVKRSWVRGFEQELALKLVPFLGVEKSKELAGDVAKLAEKRVSEAGLVQALEVKCGGCGVAVSSHGNTCLCSVCAGKTMVVLD